MTARSAPHPPDEPPTWYEATAHARPPCPTLAGDHDADVCIVGGGLTGLSAALELAVRDYKTVLIESCRIGYGASGRNGGQVNTGMRCGAAALIERFGLAEAKRLWSVAQEAHALIGARIDKYRIDCQRRPGTLHASLRADYRADVDREVAAMVEHFGYNEARRVDRDEIRQLLATDIYHGGMVDRGASHLHPLNYAIGLAHAAIAAGATIHENSARNRDRRGRSRRHHEPWPHPRARHDRRLQRLSRRPRARADAERSCRSRTTSSRPNRSARRAPANLTATISRCTTAGSS